MIKQERDLWRDPPQFTPQYFLVLPESIREPTREPTREPIREPIRESIREPIRGSFVQLNACDCDLVMSRDPCLTGT